MFEKKERTSLAIYLHYNRDARKLSQFGDIVYHSRRLRYLILYVDGQQAADLKDKLEKEKFVKRVEPSYLKDLDQNFVGSLWREEEKNIVL